MRFFSLVALLFSCRRILCIFEKEKQQQQLHEDSLPDVEYR
jgi:hypothetical protein